MAVYLLPFYRTLEKPHNWIANDPIILEKPEEVPTTIVRTLALNGHTFASDQKLAGLCLILSSVDTLSLFSLNSSSTIGFLSRDEWLASPLSDLKYRINLGGE